MIEAFQLGRFKSFGEAAELPLHDLTVLVGANASGKSNAVEALRLLSWLARGRRLGDLLASEQEREQSARGTVTDWPHDGNQFFDLGCRVGLAQGPVWLELRVRVGDPPRIVQEELTGPPGSTVPAYRLVEPARRGSHDCTVEYNNFARGGRKPRIFCSDQTALFTQLTTPARFQHGHKRAQAEVPRLAEQIRSLLEGILFLDPVPARMRGYAFLEDRTLRGDGGNLSAVLRAVCSDARVKREVLEFVRSLPEGELTDLEFKEGPRNDVILAAHERFGTRDSVERLASLLSDGTLRVLAVAAALISAPRGSLVVIEEIDNGVHPSRAAALVERIQATARRRGLRVLLTTHNPALLDAVPDGSIPHVVFCYRDPEDGDSRLVRLSDLPDYPRLVAQGPLGGLVTSGLLDRCAKEPTTPARRKEALRDLVSLLRGEPAAST